jgi:putative SOS response-associated peptidase YedK
MCNAVKVRSAHREAAELLKVTSNEPVMFDTGDKFPARGLTGARALIPIIFDDGSVRRMAGARWDLVPRWWRQPLERKGFSTSNARAESLHTTRSYRHLLEDGRCVVPVDEFYEWTGPKGRKRKHAFRSSAGGPVLLAGLFERWRQGDSTLLSCTIVTTAPAPDFAPFHNREPAVLTGREAAETWLRAPFAEAEALLRPVPLAAFAVEPPEPVIGS